MGERDWRLFIYGGVASCIAECGTFPIDTTKTRLQIQGQKFDIKHAEVKYRGMTDAFLQISKQEGFLALYSGTSRTDPKYCEDHSLFGPQPNLCI